MELETSEPGRLFIDLFRPDPGSGVPEAREQRAGGNGPARGRGADDGTYLLRLQPELYAAGTDTLTQQALASLRFPVLGRDSRAVSSGFGAGRDGGRREHHGIDDPAPRGTTVLSAGDGVVSSVTVTDIGGRVVWVQDSARDLSLVLRAPRQPGRQRGHPGTGRRPSGTAGNTGNARTTVPHLHFGIYRRGEGPIDPMPFVHEPLAAPVPPAADTSALGAWRRIEGSSTPLSTSPIPRAPVVVELPRATVVRVLGATAGWYRVRLPDDRAGFVPVASTRAIDDPLRTESRAAASPIRDRPTPAAATLGYMEPDRPVPVLGRFNDYLLVRAAAGKTGWLASEGPGGDDRSLPDSRERPPR